MLNSGTYANLLCYRMSWVSIWLWCQHLFHKKFCYTVPIILPTHIFNCVYLIWRYINSLEKWKHFSVSSIMLWSQAISKWSNPPLLYITLISMFNPWPKSYWDTDRHALSNWKRNGGKNYGRHSCLSMPFASWHVLFQNKLAVHAI